MRKSIFILVLALSACAAAGGLKPTIFTAPPSYLDSFPLGTITESEMISKAGPPDKMIEFARPSAGSGQWSGYIYGECLPRYRRGVARRSCAPGEASQSQSIKPGSECFAGSIDDGARLGK